MLSKTYAQLKLYFDYQQKNADIFGPLVKKYLENPNEITAMEFYVNSAKAWHQFIADINSGKFKSKVDDKKSKQNEYDTLLIYLHTIIRHLASLVEKRTLHSINDDFYIFSAIHLVLKGIHADFTRTLYPLVQYFRKTKGTEDEFVDITIIKQKPLSDSIVDITNFLSYHILKYGTLLEASDRADKLFITFRASTFSQGLTVRLTLYRELIERGDDFVDTFDRTSPSDEYLTLIHASILEEFLSLPTPERDPFHRRMMNSAGYCQNDFVSPKPIWVPDKRLSSWLLESKRFNFSILVGETIFDLLNNMTKMYTERGTSSLEFEALKASITALLALIPAEATLIILDIKYHIDRLTIAQQAELHAKDEESKAMAELLLAAIEEEREALRELRGYKLASIPNQRAKQRPKAAIGPSAVEIQPIAAAGAEEEPVYTLSKAEAFLSTLKSSLTDQCKAIKEYLETNKDSLSNLDRIYLHITLAERLFSDKPKGVWIQLFQEQIDALYSLNTKDCSQEIKSLVRSSINNLSRAITQGVPRKDKAPKGSQKGSSPIPEPSSLLRVALPDDAKHILEAFEACKKKFQSDKEDIQPQDSFYSEAFVVGGLVRDLVQEIQSNQPDIDLVINYVAGFKENLLFQDRLKKELSALFKIDQGSITLNFSEHIEGYCCLKIGEKEYDLFFSPARYTAESDRVRDARCNSLRVGLSGTVLETCADAISDAQNKVYRPIDMNTFFDDPVRVLRALHARFNKGYKLDAEFSNKIESFLGRLKDEEAFERYLGEHRGHFVAYLKKILFAATAENYQNLVKYIGKPVFNLLSLKARYALEATKKTGRSLEALIADGTVVLRGPAKPAPITGVTKWGTFAAPASSIGSEPGTSKKDDEPGGTEPAQKKQ